MCLEHQSGVLEMSYEFAFLIRLSTAQSRFQQFCFNWEIDGNI